MRSWLMIPGADPETLDAAFLSGADALVIDLHTVLPDRKDRARDVTTAFLEKTASSGQAHPARFVLIHPLSSPLAARDLSAVMRAAPDGIALPGTCSGADVQQLDVMISVEEALSRSPRRRTDILAICGDSAAGALSAHSFADRSPRLSALAWSLPGIMNDLQAARSHARDGRLADAARLTRSLVQLGAAAAGVDLIDTPSGLLRSERLTRDCREAAADGFTGKFALHPSQVPVINEAFMPSASEIERARDIAELFDGHHDTTAIGRDGSILTARDLARALRTLLRASAAQMPNF